MTGDPGRGATAAALVAVGAATVASVLIFGYGSSALALLSRCGENIPPERHDRCEWLEDGGWWQLIACAAGLAVASTAVAAWLRSPYVLVLGALLAMALALAGPLIAAP